MKSNSIKNDAHNDYREWGGVMNHEIKSRPRLGVATPRSQPLSDLPDKNGKVRVATHYLKNVTRNLS